MTGSEQRRGMTHPGPPTPFRYVGAFLAAGAVSVPLLLLGFAGLDALSKVVGWFVSAEYLAAAGIAGWAAYGVALIVFAGAEGVTADRRENAAKEVTTVLVLLGVAWLLLHNGGTEPSDF